MSENRTNLAAVDKLMAVTLLTVFAHTCAYVSSEKKTRPQPEKPAPAASAQPHCTENACFIPGLAP